RGRKIGMTSHRRDNRHPENRRRGRACPLLAAVAAIASLAYGILLAGSAAPPGGLRATTSEAREATAEEVHRLCAACHAYPPPDTFPRSAWRREVKQGYDFFHDDPSYRFDYPPLDAVVRYYEKRAPQTLAQLPYVA